MTNKLSLDFGWITPPFRRKIMQNVIVDRKSKYTVVWGQKSTHNTYAYRIKLENWSILEGKNDDGETWAWNCILRELQRAEAINTIVVVTRYFWWIHLQADRFKNVIESTKIILNEF